MKKLIDIIIATVAGLLFCITVHAQQSKHEFFVYGGGGLSTLNYSVSVGEQKSGLGGLAGVGYTFFFTPNWGLTTGAELALYNSTFKLNNLLVVEKVFDIENETFEFNSTISNYEERQTAGFLQIPLMLQFQSGGKHQFYVAAGGKAGIPVIKTYKSEGATLQNAGYYSYESYTYTTQEFLGFGTFTGRGSDGNLDFKVAFFASAETGVKWRLSPNISLYTGVYMDYGLNNAVDNQTSPFVDYAGNLALNSILHATYRDNKDNLQAYSDKVTPLAAGVKVRLAFSGNRKAVRDAVAPPSVFTLPEINTVEEKATKPAVQPEVSAPTAIDEAQRLAEQSKVEAAVRKVAEEKEKAQHFALAKEEIQLPADNYALSQTELATEQKQELDQKIKFLMQYPELEVFIYGHTCDIGGDKVNETVGIGRAQKAKEYLISKGIDEKRILGIASKRDTEPLLPNTNEGNRRINRRVEVVIN